MAFILSHLYKQEDMKYSLKYKIQETQANCMVLFYLNDQHLLDEHGSQWHRACGVHLSVRN